MITCCAITRFIVWSQLTICAGQFLDLFFFFVIPYWIRGSDIENVVSRMNPKQLSDGQIKFEGWARQVGYLFVCSFSLFSRFERPFRSDRAKFCLLENLCWVTLVLRSWKLVCWCMQRCCNFLTFYQKSFFRSTISAETCVKSGNLFGPTMLSFCWPWRIRKKLLLPR